MGELIIPSDDDNEVLFTVACAKGCGVALGVTNLMMKEAKRLNMPIVVQHGTCPGESGMLNRYRYSIKVWVARPNLEEDRTEDVPLYADEVEIASLGDVVEGKSFADVFDDISVKIQNGWQQVEKMRHLADQ